jgi:peptidyl-tRNA hydrolase
MNILETTDGVTANELYSGPPVEDADVLSIYVVLNGSLNMTPGKAASQSFHCGWMSGAMTWRLTEKHQEEYARWVRQGRRVVTRVAETPHVFQRVIDECAGFVQRDEGLTEVERGSATAFVSIPYRRSSIPKILTHKRVQLYKS